MPSNKNENKFKKNVITFQVNDLNKFNRNKVKLFGKFTSLNERYPVSEFNTYNDCRIQIANNFDAFSKRKQKTNSKHYI